MFIFIPHSFPYLLSYPFLSPYPHPTYVLFIFFNNLLSPICAANKLMGVEPYTGSWWLAKCHLLNKNGLSLLQETPTDNSSSVWGGRMWASSHTVQGHWLSWPCESLVLVTPCHNPSSSSSSLLHLPWELLNLGGGGGSGGGYMIQMRLTLHRHLFSTLCPLVSLGVYYFSLYKEVPNPLFWFWQHTYSKVICI